MIGGRVVVITVAAKLPKLRESPSHCVTEDDLNKKTSSIVDFYNGKSIFITGGTGFLGKMYIRNILHRCPGICKIYMLIRPTKNSVEGRLEDMIKNSMNLFEGLNENHFMKLVPIEGDVTAPNLGIHPDKNRLLQEQVSIIVHSAATLDINATLREAYHVNVIGTENLLALAKDMKKLHAFLHLSTFYCCMTNEKNAIEEKVYSPPLYVKDVPKTLEKYGHMRFPPQSLLGNKQNTYIFTKAISEYLVSSTHGDIPTAIIRPSLIGCSNKDPYKGWIDVFNVHSFILTAISNGFLRILNINKNTVWDFIPVDYVANLMILAATKCKKSTQVDIYNCASSGINPVTILSASSIFISDFVTNKNNEFPLPLVLYLESKLLGRLLNPFVHLIPAFINDVRYILTGRKANSVKSIKKLLKIKDQIKFFGGHSWKAKSDHVTSLINSLSDEDRKKFPCDPSDIDWVEYSREYSKGTRNYLSKN